MVKRAPAVSSAPTSAAESTAARCRARGSDGNDHAATKTPQLWSRDERTRSSTLPDGGFTSTPTAETNGSRKDDKSPNVERSFESLLFAARLPAQLNYDDPVVLQTDSSAREGGAASRVEESIQERQRHVAQHFCHQPSKAKPLSDLTRNHDGELYTSHAGRTIGTIGNVQLLPDRSHLQSSDQTLAAKKLVSAEAEHSSYLQEPGNSVDLKPSSIYCSQKNRMLPWTTDRQLAKEASPAILLSNTLPDGRYAPAVATPADLRQYLPMPMQGRQLLGSCCSSTSHPDVCNHHHFEVQDCDAVIRNWNYAGVNRPCMRSKHCMEEKENYYTSEQRFGDSLHDLCLPHTRSLCDQQQWCHHDWCGALLRPGQRTDQCSCCPQSQQLHLNRQRPPGLLDEHQLASQFAHQQGVTRVPLVDFPRERTPEKRSWLARQLELEKVEFAARKHKMTALYGLPGACWSGVIPKSRGWQGVMPASAYSRKLFIGGLPLNITEGQLLGILKRFGPVKIERPPGKGAGRRQGYVYVIFDNQTSVVQLLESCQSGGEPSKYYLLLPDPKYKDRFVEIIPWLIEDERYSSNECCLANSEKSHTVFIGNIHGQLSALGLAIIMSELFGSVVEAVIDTDKYKYPTGAGRVTFSDRSSYLKAVATGIIEVRTKYFLKKLQIDPYLEFGPCAVCGANSRYFCRSESCFCYYCGDDWLIVHSSSDLAEHQPLRRF